VAQSGRAKSLRHKEHLQYIRNNNPISAYAMHILHNRHQFGPADETLKLLKPCNKGIKMNCWEALYMNMLYKQGLLISKQQVTTLTHYLIWQPSHVTYRPLPLTVVPSPSYRAHTPQGKSRSTSSIVILSPS